MAALLLAVAGLHRAWAESAAEPSPSAAVARVLAQSDSLFAARQYSQADTLLERTLRTAGRDSTDLAWILGAQVKVVGWASWARARSLAARWESADPFLAARFGSESLTYSWLLAVRERAAEGLGDWTQARTFAERALAIRERLLPPDDLQLGPALDALAALARRRGDLGEAERYAERALSIYRAKLGDLDQLTIATFTSLAQFQAASGHLDAAKRSAEAARTNAEKLFGVGQRLTGRPLFALALVELQRGEEERALRTLQSAIQIFRRDYGERSREFLSARSVEGDIYQSLGDYPAAAEAYEEALEVQRATLPPGDYSLAVTLNNLATTLIDMGSYERGREILEQARAQIVATSGEESADLIEVDNNLAVLATLTGDRTAALEAARRAVALCDGQILEDSPTVALGCAQLALGFEGLFGYEKTDSLVERGMSLFAEQAAGEHAELGDTWLLRAKVAWQRARLAEAHRYAARGLEILERTRGPNHPATAGGAKTLVDILLAEGNLREARERNDRSLRTLEDTYSDLHPLVADGFYQRSQIAAAEGRIPAALTSALRSESIRRRHVRLTIESMPERSALEYAEERKSGLDLALAVSEGYAWTAAEAESLYDAVIASRALVLDALAGRRHRLRLAAPDSLQDEYRAASRRLARLLVQGASGGDDDVSKDLERAKREYEEAERQLARGAAPDDRAPREFAWRDLEPRLGPSEAFVSFVRYAAPTASGEPAGDAAYLAFVARPGAAPRGYRLGSADAIDALVRAWREEVSRAPSAAAADLRVGAALRRVVWDPFATDLADVRRVFLVPDAALQLVSFAALPIDESGRFLVERDPEITVLAAERDLLRPEAAEPANDGGLLALGDVSFDADPDPAAHAAAKATGADESHAGAVEVAVTRPLYRGAGVGCRDFRDVKFEPLPMTATELDRVVSSWSRAADREAAAPRVTRLDHAAATETAFKQQASGRRVLHLATHGVFLDARCEFASGGRGIGGLGRPSGSPPPAAVAPPPSAATEVPIPPTSSKLAEPASASPAEEAVRDPLRLAALALAGANRRDQATPGEDDGVLTAEEIAALDLEGVEWAVLSACDTGVGETRASEGVFGLRRALRMAGVRTSILSLWAIEDESALAFMSALYAHRWGDRLTTSAAMRAAYRDVLQARREAGLSTHPFYWAGFLACGN